MTVVRPPDAAALVDPVAATPGLRTLGFGAQQAMPGNTPVGGEGVYSVTAYGAVPGGDAAAACTLAIAAAGLTGGTILIPRGDWLWNSVPKIPSGLTGRLMITGQPGTKVTLTSGGPRFVDFDRTADYQTFRHVDIRDLVIDCNNVTGTGLNHVVIGTGVNGSENSQRANFEDISVRRIRTLNVPVTGADRRNVWITSRHVSAGEATQTHITDILIEDCDFAGGLYGVTLAATGGSTGVNVLVDRVIVRRINHDLGSDPSGFVGSAHVHIGSRAIGGSCHVHDIWGRGSRDVGIEINALENAVIENCTMTNCNGFYYLHVNYATPTNPDAQTITFRNCHARWTAGTHVADASGFLGCINTGGVTLGRVIVRACSMIKTTSDWTSDGTAIKVSGAMKGLHVDGFTYSEPNLSITTASINPTTFYLQPATLTPLSLRNVRVRIAGVISGGTISQAAVFGIYGSSVLDWDNIEVNISGIAAGNHQIRGFNIGQVTGSVLGPSLVRRAKFTITDATTPDLFRIYGVTPLTINGTLLISEPDFSGVTSPGNEIEAATGVENLDKVVQVKNGVVVP